LFFLAALIMLRQLVTEGYFSCITEDAYTFTSWAWQFVEALKEGILYPRWLSLNSWSYGSATFIFYSPLAYYIVAFFNVFTGSIITAMNITKFMALFISGAGIFFLVREFYPKKIALLTSSLYIVFPYNIFQFYFVGTFASTVSIIWFSPIILFTYRYTRDRNYKYIFYTGLCYAGLILTHLINAYMFTFVLAAFTIYISIARKENNLSFSFLFIITIGFLLSSAYIIPIIFEKQFVMLNSLISHDYNYSYYFLFPDMTYMFPQGSLWPVYYETMLFFFVFLFFLIFISLTCMVRISQMKILWRSLSMEYFFLIIALWSLFLLLGISKFIWEYIPFFKYIQFPYRWLNITTFAVVFLSAVIFYTQDHYNQMKNRCSLFIVLFFLICLILDYRYITTAHIFTETSLIPIKHMHWNYEQPIWVNQEKIDKGEDVAQGVEIKKGKGIAETMAWKSAERVIQIEALTTVTLRIRTFYFPGWKAYVNSKKTEIKTEYGTGAMIISVPEGKHTLLIRFEDTPVRYYAKLVSIVTLFILVVLYAFTRKSDKKSNP